GCIVFYILLLQVKLAKYMFLRINLIMHRIAEEALLV
ncbi:hypothetical protein CP02DC14_1946, partial [Chlamydia psittaci 02DC14]